MKKAKKALAADFSHPKAHNVPSTPFHTSWGNNRPLASSTGIHESPGGVLSPKELAGVGVKKTKKGK